LCKRLNQILKLEEERAKALKKTDQRQHKSRNILIKVQHFFFQKGEFVLLWNKAKEKPSTHTNFEAL